MRGRVFPGRGDSTEIEIQEGSLRESGREIEEGTHVGLQGL